MGRKLGAVPPLWGRGTGYPSNTMCPGPRPTCMPRFILIHSTAWPQYMHQRHRQTDRQDRQRSDSIARTFLQMVAQKLATGRCESTRHRASRRTRGNFAFGAMLSQHRNQCTDCKSAEQCTTRRHPLPFPKLHPGPCSSVGMQRGTDSQTDT